MRTYGARRLDHHRRIGAVVLRAGAEVPGIEVRAEQHDLIGPFASAELRHHVTGFERAAGTVGDLQPNAHRTVRRKPGQASRLLARYYGRGDGDGFIRHGQRMPVEQRVGRVDCTKSAATPALRAASTMGPRVAWLPQALPMPECGKRLVIFVNGYSVHRLGDLL
jgi:hypothetical protein